MVLSPREFVACSGCCNCSGRAELIQLIMSFALNLHAASQQRLGFRAFV
jgi:hypothetical protein